MKTFSFFSEKGGVGKTTLTILFAAYLAYAKGFKVKVIDAEAPTFRINRFRQIDEQNLKTEGSVLYNYSKARELFQPYPIECWGKEVNMYTRQDLNDFIRKVQVEVNDDKFDYLLIDFPAGYSEMTPIRGLSMNELLDLAYIPTSTEGQERRAAYRIGKDLLANGQDVRVLWNRIDSRYIKNPDILDDAEQPFLDKAGLKHSKVRIKAFNKATLDSKDRCFVRNTVCWPERYIQMACPELKDLFEEIVAILDTKE